MTLVVVVNNANEETRGADSETTVWNDTSATTEARWPTRQHSHSLSVLLLLPLCAGTRRKGNHVQERRNLNVAAISPRGFRVMKSRVVVRVVKPSLRAFAVRWRAEARTGKETTSSRMLAQLFIGWWLVGANLLSLFSCVCVYSEPSDGGFFFF
jgi:hypothetical protein